MSDDKIQIFCGPGNGRSAAALGMGVRYACAGKSVFWIRFLKGKLGNEMNFLTRLEPEIKLFSFDKYDEVYSHLSDAKKKEEKEHIRTSLNFAHKVLITDECDVLILDEILDLMFMGIVEEEDIRSLIQHVSDNMILILTGRHECRELWPYATRVTVLTTAAKEQA